MCKLTLNAVVTRALADEHFRATLLHGNPGRAFDEFSLNDTERALLQNIQASSLETFVAQVHVFMQPQPVLPVSVAGVASAVSAYPRAGVS